MGKQVQDPPVTAVVLNWHGRPDTLRCVHALAALSYPQLSLVLIDNGCAEFSAAELTAIFPRTQYLRTPVNLGFAGGADLGMRQALAAGAHYVWFLNSDAAPEPEALHELVAVAAGDPRNAIVSPKILLPAPQRLDSIALRVDLRSGRLYLIGHDEIDQGQYDSLGAVDAVSGCAMLVSRAACEQFGGFDESFFAYVEDVDLCLRARAAGWRVCVAPRARVVHHRAPATTAARQSVSSLYYATRNHLTLIRRHAPPPRLPRLVTVLTLNLAYALRTGGRRPWPRLRAVVRGWLDYARGISGPGSGF